MRASRERVAALEIFGLRPLGPGLRQCWAAIRGDAYAPGAVFGLSSLRIFKPWISFPLWLGRVRNDRRVTIYLLPNRVRSPAAPAHGVVGTGASDMPPDGSPVPEGGYSVKVSFCRDYRGRRLSYDSHEGTDFATPPGTRVVAAAPGRVRCVRNDMQRGGLKVVIDHGAGLVSISNHLARALVRPGQRVARGEGIALSGMSSVDGVLFFPWLAPHLHFTVLLDGEAVDPFAAPGEAPLWRAGNHPEPYRPADPGAEPEPALEPTRWSEEAVRASLDACRDPALRERLEAEDDFEARAVLVALERLLNRHRFRGALPALVAKPHGRRPLLDLPFRAEDYDGVVYADEVAARAS